MSERSNKDQPFSPGNDACRALEKPLPGCHVKGEEWERGSSLFAAHVCEEKHWNLLAVARGGTGEIRAWQKLCHAFRRDQRVQADEMSAVWR